jgi:hypothetical protein
MTKSEAAFSMTAERLWEPGFRVYFWTFTFCVLHSDAEGSRLFSVFLRRLREAIGGDWGGVKVAELHRERGVHFHALVNRRLAVDVVRRVGRCHGIGRVHVCVANKGACGYLSKYLSKRRDGPVHESGRRMRRWSAFGSVVRTRVCDLVNESPMWVFRRAHGLRFTNYRFEALLSRCWEYGEACLRSGWFAWRNGRISDLVSLANGRLVPDGNGGLVERFQAVWLCSPF